LWLEIGKNWAFSRVEFKDDKWPFKEVATIAKTLNMKSHDNEKYNYFNHIETPSVNYNFKLTSLYEFNILKHLL
jgi:hypothetical protein